MSHEGYIYKHASLAPAKPAVEHALSSHHSRNGSLLHPNDAAGMKTPSRRSSDGHIGHTLATSEEVEDDDYSIGKLSIEAGNRHSSISAASHRNGKSRARGSLGDLRLKMSKDRIRDDRSSRLYIAEDDDTTRSPSPSQLRMRLSGSPLVSKSAGGLSNQPSPIRIPKRASSARHSVATFDLDVQSNASDISPSGVESPRQVPKRDSSLRHSFSASPARMKRKSHRSSNSASSHTRKSSHESQLEFPEREFAQVLDELAEDHVTRRIEELKDKKRKRERELTIATLSLPEVRPVSAIDPAALKIRLSGEALRDSTTDGVTASPMPPTPSPVDAQVEPSAPPPLIAQRVDRTDNGKTSSLLNKSPTDPLLNRQNIDLPRMRGSPPQRSNSKLLRRLSRPLSPTSAEKHRRTISGGFLQPTSPIEDEPVALDPVDKAVKGFVSSPKLSQKVADPQTGRIISFSEVGDPAGSVVFCCVGMGLTRYIMAFYDELALTLKLRLITPDRPGVGASEPRPDASDTPLAWPDDVRAICAHLKITKFSILAHSAGAIYALATALRMPQHIRGRIHLLAPWIPPSQMSVIGTQQEALPVSALPFSQRFLRSLPTPFLKAANSSWLSATSASVTTSLPKSPRKSKRDGRDARTPEPEKGSRNNSPSPLPPQVKGEHAKAAAHEKENLSPERPKMGPPMPSGSKLRDHNHLQSYDTRLTEAIWERATTDANPAVDLLVCLERRQPIGFRYVDITRAIVIHHGSKDSRVPVENVKWLGKTMRKCEVRVLDGEGHGLMASAGVMGNVLMEMAREWEDWNRVTQGRSGVERRVTAGV